MVQTPSYFIYFLAGALEGARRWESDTKQYMSHTLPRSSYLKRHPVRWLYKVSNDEIIVPTTEDNYPKAIELIA